MRIHPWIDPSKGLESLGLLVLSGHSFRMPADSGVYEAEYQR